MFKKKLDLLIANNCSGFYCDCFSLNNKETKCIMWTEAWSGWFSDFGGPYPSTRSRIALRSGPIHSQTIRWNELQKGSRRPVYHHHLRL
ncbi:putative beta-galactosidase [Helianthus anomalus]